MLVNAADWRIFLIDFIIPARQLNRGDHKPVSLIFYQVQSRILMPLALGTSPALAFRRFRGILRRFYLPPFLTVLMRAYSMELCP